jgi:hypothetical protein
LYGRTPFANTIHVLLVQFFPLSGQCINLLKHPKINDPKYVDLDGACFMMFTKDLPAFFGIIVRPANWKVLVKDLPKFDD